jgi:hypothetical protein
MAATSLFRVAAPLRSEPVPVAVGVLDLLDAEDVGRAQVMGDVGGQGRELGVRIVRRDVLEVVGADRQVAGVAGQAGGLQRQGPPLVVVSTEVGSTSYSPPK